MDLIKLAIEIILGLILFAFFIYLTARVGTLGAMRSIDQAKKEKILNENLRKREPMVKEECN